jgi:hypothetical protein
MRTRMIANLVAPALALVVACGAPALAADGDQPGAPTQQAESGVKVESGVKKVGEGIGETASGLGQAVVEGTNVAANAVAGGAKRTGRIAGRVGKNVGKGATAAWETVRDRAIDFADDVVRFVSRPF